MVALTPFLVLPLLGAATSPDVPPGSSLPVLGQAYVGALGQAQERPPTMVVTVHGVRRIEGATVLYYSVGFSGEAPDPELLPVTEYGTGPGTFGTLQASSGATFMDTAAVIDVPGKRSYGALRRGQGRAVAGPAPVRAEDRVRMSDRAVVQWIALAPIPATLKTVDVLVGSVFVRAVPVGNGLLEPVVDDPMPTVGSGWPRVDTLAIGGARVDGTTAGLQVRVAARPRPTASPTTPPTARPPAGATPAAPSSRPPTPSPTS